MDTAQDVKALTGVNVLAFIQGIAGPLVCMTLAGCGARVVRVESRTRLELHRQIGPYLGNIESPDRTLSYLCFNGGEMGITVNLKHPRALQIMTRAVRWADVIIENFAQGGHGTHGAGV
jgi:benzylsuccinate CoA-transferase BbsF subunit